MQTRLPWRPVRHLSLDLRPLGCSWKHHALPRAGGCSLLQRQGLGIQFERRIRLMTQTAHSRSCHRFCNGTAAQLLFLLSWPIPGKFSLAGALSLLDCFAALVSFDFSFVASVTYATYACCLLCSVQSPFRIHVRAFAHRLLMARLSTQTADSA